VANGSYEDLSAVHLVISRRCVRAAGGTQGGTHPGEQCSPLHGRLPRSRSLKPCSTGLCKSFYGSTLAARENLAPSPMALVDVRDVKEIGCERPPLRARTFVQAATQRVAHTPVPDPGASWSRAPTNCSFVNALTYARCRCPTRTARHREVLGMRMMGTYCSWCPASCAPITGAIVGRPSASSSLGALRRPLRGCGLDESCGPPELATAQWSPCSAGRAIGASAPLPRVSPRSPDHLLPSGRRQSVGLSRLSRVVPGTWRRGRISLT
jgi:hypothetical protein